jgi:leucyl aminopeptidase
MTDIVGGAELENESGELLAIPVFVDRIWGPGGDWVVDQMGASFEGYLDDVGFEGKVGQVVAFPTGGRIDFRTVMLVGLGDETDLEGVRRAAGWIGRRAMKVRDVATTLPAVDVEGAAAATVEGFLLGQYSFDRYQSKPEIAATATLRFVGSEVSLDGIERSRILAKAVAWARDLVNEPAGGKSPETLAAMAVEVSRDLPVTVEVMDQDQISQERLGGLMAVAAGSSRPPRLVVLRYEPENAGAFLALVGKGITFDSGGLSLKPAAGMETMKTDMSGAAAVLASVRAIAELGLPVRILAITPLTDNMPGGSATKPGDVLTARNGKTIEILNTDAEGRLVLADGLSLAAEAEPDLIVDIATLTGACHVALGDKIAGLWSTSDDAIARVRSAAERAGERVWHMPLPDDYRKNIDSDIADMKNTGPRFGGAINAALLLKEFAGDDPWVHLDIAGPARWPDDEHYQSKGGSGFGVRTLVALAEDMGSIGR